MCTKVHKRRRLCFYGARMDELGPKTIYLKIYRFTKWNHELLLTLKSFMMPQPGLRFSSSAALRLSTKTQRQKGKMMRNSKTLLAWGSICFCPVILLSLMGFVQLLCLSHNCPPPYSPTFWMQWIGAQNFNTPSVQGMQFGMQRYNCDDLRREVCFFPLKMYKFT